jgi:hypothetical protein
MAKFGARTGGPDGGAYTLSAPNLAAKLGTTMVTITALQQKTNKEKGHATGAAAGPLYDLGPRRSRHLAHTNQANPANNSAAAKPSNSWNSRRKVGSLFQRAPRTEPI